ncbi:MAG: peptidylprolyl isomerase [Candidatus Methanomethylophilaceae archaeon]|jgi:peptidyl-prolyl cis-trans isomerase C
MAAKANAAHILVGSENDARKIMERLEKGEEFAALAKRFSKCPSKNKGGDLGWFSKGQMVKEFEDAVFSSKKGSVVGPVKTEFGWHIIYVKDLK